MDIPAPVRTARIHSCVRDITVDLAVPYRCAAWRALYVTHRQGEVGVLRSRALVMGWFIAGCRSASCPMASSDLFELTGVTSALPKHIHGTPPDCFSAVRAAGAMGNDPGVFFFLAASGSIGPGIIAMARWSPDGQRWAQARISSFDGHHVPTGASRVALPLGSNASS